VANESILKQKAGVVSEIVDKVKDSSSVILVDYRGLTVEEFTNLRKELRESDSDLKVYKNTLTKRAMDELKLDLGDDLNGPSAIAFSKDVVTPAKILSTYAKKHDALKIKVGIIDGEVSGLDVITKLASIPSREGLLTMLAGGMIAVVRDLSISLDLYSKNLEEGKSGVIKSEVKEEVATEAAVTEVLPEETENKEEEKGKEE